MKGTLAAAAMMLAAGGVARADVLEIGPDGAVTVLAGPAAAAPGARAPGAPSSIEARIADAARTTSLSPDLLQAVAWAESRFDDGARSPAGAVGAMQLMPQTAAELGVDPNDPVDNVRGGAAYLRRLLDDFDGDLTLALAAYNAGPSAVLRHQGVPPYAETRAYVAAVLDYMSARTGEGASLQ